MNSEGMINNYGSRNAVLYIIPQEEETRIDILNIDQDTKNDVRLLHRLYADNNWQCNTIADVVVEMMIKMLYGDLKNTRDGNSTFNFYDLIEAYVTVKRDENAEKEGNINIAFRTGSRVDAIISDDTSRENRELKYIDNETRYSFVENAAKTEKMKLLDKLARKELGEKYGIILPDAWAAIAIADTFLENLFRELIRKVVLTNKPTASINFNDNIEFHAIMKKEGITLTMRPGMNAKLLIKSDEITEDDDSDDGDF